MLVWIFIVPFFLSGCFFQPDSSPSADSYIETEIRVEGYINIFKKGVLDNQYSLTDKNKNVMFLLQSEINLKTFEGKKVIVTGVEIPSNKNESIALELRDIKEIHDHHKSQYFPEISVEARLSNDIEITKKTDNVTFYDTVNDFSVSINQLNSQQHEEIINDLDQNIDIIINQKTAKRVTQGKTTTLYLLEKPFLKITFRGDDSKKSFFYDFIKTLSFITSETSYQSTQENTELQSSDTLDKGVLKQQIKSSLKTILEEEEAPEIRTISFYENNLIDIEYFLPKNKSKNRVVLQTKQEGGQTIFSIQAKYKEGTVMSWDLIEGETPDLAGESEIFITEINAQKPITLPEDFSLYVSTHFNFQLGYPKQMYFSASGKTDTRLASVSFAPAPVTTENAVIILEIIPGEIPENIENQNIFVAPRDDKSYFKISALDHSFKFTAKKILQTIRSL